MTPDDIIFIIVLIYSIILHEIAHGYVAYREGDNTAKWAGRLTLNPLPHIDPIGSILIPILSYIGAGAAFGWAKGVPYNPHMLRHKYSEAKVAVAGVATNFALAIIAAAIFYFTKSFNTGLGFDLLSSLINILNTFLVYVVIINISLGIFNLMPLPPFDGMRLIASLFPHHTKGLMQMIDRNSTIYLMISIYLAYHLFDYIAPMISRLISSLLVL